MLDPLADGKQSFAVNFASKDEAVQGATAAQLET
jgi:hypothetical protein